jgi:imidazolonepropionase-like amidohydrolase
MVSRDLLIVGARLIDGTGAPPRDDCAIRIQEGNITEIRQGSVRDVETGQEQLLDVDGATVLPGIIDPHIHLQAVPGATFRGDDEKQRREARHHGLRAYLACGVTTVLDAAVHVSVLRETRAHLDTGGVGPRYLALAPAFYPPGGYLDNNYLTDAWGPMWKPAGTPEDVRSLFADYEDIEGIIGIKVLVEHGFGRHGSYEIHSPAMRTCFVEEAKDRDLPIFVHAIRTEDHRIALELQPRAIMHSGLLGQPCGEAHIERMRTLGTAVMTSFSSMFDCLFARKTFLGRIEDPLIRSTVPQNQLETAEDPRAWKFQWKHLFRAVVPSWMPDWMCSAIAAVATPGPAERALRKEFETCRQRLLELHAAGVPIVMATDAGAWPLFTACFHGPSTIREVELMGELGLEPMTVIEASSRLPAEVLGLADRIGTVEVGKAGDLVVLAEDPLTDLSAFRSIKWTVQGGEARSPADWLCGQGSRNP